MFCVAGMEVYV